MISKIIVLCSVSIFTLYTHSQQGDSRFFGEKFDIQIPDEQKLDKIDVFDGAANPIQIKGKIISSCAKKGCWINMDIDGNSLFVKFKDYAFFVPTSGLEGKSAIVNGKLSVDTLSVETLRHYAEDDGQSQKEILAIKEPKVTLSFLADGVYIQ